MKSGTQHRTWNLPVRMAFRNITAEVEAAVRPSGVREGLMLVNAMPITASVLINDEPGLHADSQRWLEWLAPFDASPTTAPAQTTPTRTRSGRSWAARS